METIDIVLIIMCVLAALLVGFLIPVLVSIRKTIDQAGLFIAETDRSLKVTLVEVDETLRSVRQVTDDVNAITSSARNISDSANEVAASLRHASHEIDRATSKASLGIVGLRAGLGAALDVLLRQFSAYKGGRS